MPADSGKGGRGKGSRGGAGSRYRNKGIYSNPNNMKGGNSKFLPPEPSSSEKPPENPGTVDLSDLISQTTQIKEYGKECFDRVPCL